MSDRRSRAFRRRRATPLTYAPGHRHRSFAPVPTSSPRRPHAVPTPSPRRHSPSMTQLWLPNGPPLCTIATDYGQLGNWAQSMAHWASVTSHNTQCHNIGQAAPGARVGAASLWTLCRIYRHQAPLSPSPASYPPLCPCPIRQVVSARILPKLSFPAFPMGTRSPFLKFFLL
jgi:hypothetical protein